MESVEMRYKCHINYDDCEFECNNCDGNRWIFSFNGMKIGY